MPIPTPKQPYARITCGLPTNRESSQMALCSSVKFPTLKNCQFQSMGRIRMSESDLRRIEVLSDVPAGSHASARSILRRYPLGEIPLVCTLRCYRRSDLESADSRTAGVAAEPARSDFWIVNFVSKFDSGTNRSRELAVRYGDNLKRRPCNLRAPVLRCKPSAQNHLEDFEAALWICRSTRIGPFVQLIADS